MKNIHVLKTNKPSRFFEILQFNFVFDNQNKYSEEYKKLHKYKNKNIYITSDEEIKEGDWFITTDTNEIYKSDWIKFRFNNGKKIILTTDKSLINDGVQSIDDEFLEWFVKNSSCEYVEIADLWKEGTPSAHDSYQIIIPKEEPKQETLKHTSKFIVFTLQDSEDWVQHSIPLDSFEKADNFCQQFRDKKMSYLICQTLKQGYNGK